MDFVRRFVVAENDEFGVAEEGVGGAIGPRAGRSADLNRRQRIEG